MKRTPAMFALVALASTFAGVASAQPRVLPPPPGRAVVQQVVSERRAERWDLKTLEDLRKRFDAARARNNRTALNAVDADLQRYLAAELREAREEQADARAATQDARGYAGRGEVRQARAEVRQETRELQRIRAISRELEPLYRRVDKKSLKKKDALLGELTQLARAELTHERNARR